MSQGDAPLISALVRAWNSTNIYFRLLNQQLNRMKLVFNEYWVKNVFIIVVFFSPVGCHGYGCLPELFWSSSQQFWSRHKSWWQFFESVSGRENLSRRFHPSTCRGSNFFTKGWSPCLSETSGHVRTGDCGCPAGQCNGHRLPPGTDGRRQVAPVFYRACLQEQTGHDRNMIKLF